jgi:hypothetical protein
LALAKVVVIRLCVISAFDNAAMVAFLCVLVRPSLAIVF